MRAMKVIIKRRTVISELMRNARSINLSRVSRHIVCICACSSTRINFSWNFRHLRNIPISEYTAKADGSKYEILLSGTGTRGEFFPNWVYTGSKFLLSLICYGMYDGSIMDDRDDFAWTGESKMWNKIFFFFFEFSTKSNSPTISFLLLREYSPLILMNHVRNINPYKN